MTIELRAVLWLIMVIGIVMGINHYNDLRERAAIGDLRGDKIERTADVIVASSAVDQQKTTDETRVAESRAAYNEGKKNATDLVDRNALLVPNSVRSLARERRLARERSDGDSGDGGKATAAAHAGER